ncbi:hypothetical protein AB0L40_20265 [Patulibacter sp. NPDC049589]|uniref:hypothetical protein n=1 Tax=Patulibacter sp. NPDC049589 TaxID=3154731 RepID=UPI00341EFEA2
MPKSASVVAPAVALLALTLSLGVATPQASAKTRHCPKYGRAYDITAKRVTCKTARSVYRTARRDGDAISLGYRCDVAAPSGTRHLRYTCRNGKRSVAFSIRGGTSF